jgi:hypothetical protein
MAGDPVPDRPNFTATTTLWLKVPGFTRICSSGRGEARGDGSRRQARRFTLAGNRRHAKVPGEMIVIRYADDTIVGFQHEHEARAFLNDLKDRCVSNARRVCTGGGWQRPSLP